MNFRYDKSYVLLIASTIAVIGLVIFQLTWMQHSRRLSDEIFNQRVYMALCSTVESYGGGALCSKSSSEGAATCLPAEPMQSSFVIPSDLAEDSTFNTQLRRTLDFYQVDLDYQIHLSDAAVTEEDAVIQCAIAVPSDSSDQSAFINLSFDDKDKFISANMPYMFMATILILLFTAIVLLFANWSLLKQKKLLETNVDFFNNMAHELRTPLTNIGLAANMLTKKQQLQGNDFIEIIKRENTKMQGQVERVLHLASVENGDYTLHKERLQLKSLLVGVLDEMQMQIKERQATVTVVDAVSDHMEVFGDRVHLSNVFRNLLDNALKYSKEKPEIQISAAEQGKGIIVSMEDNGIGIPSGQCALIFEKFQRAGQGDLHERKGFGLGLAYVKRMVELHNGSVRVNSELNKGSRFDVFLPA